MNATPIPYKPYIPSKWEKRIDSAVGLIAPGMAVKRAQAREQINRFRYLSAQGNDARPNANPFTGSGETARGNAERRQMMWNAIDAIENSGIAWGVVNKFRDYVAGTVRYQARTGDKVINNELEEYVAERSKKGLDYGNRHTLRQQAKLVVTGMIVKGDCGINVVRDDNTIFTQGIEADRIGNPYQYAAYDNYVGGIHINQRGGMAGADIFRRDRMSGNYQFERTLPAYNQFGLQTFMLCVNPITFDDVRGRTVFARTIDNIHYLNEIRRYELQALMWAASQSGVYYTKSGGLPDLPFEDHTTERDAYGNALTKFSALPNTITALGMGEDVKMFQHERPSPNVMAMYKDTIREIAVGVGLSFGMVWDMTDLQGPGVRAASNQDKRAIQGWQLVLGEGFLEPTVDWILRDGIAKRDIPYHPKYNKGTFIFPAHPTIDVGRESAADLNELAAAVNTGANICAEGGFSIEEVRDQAGHETEDLIEQAMEIAGRKGIKDWREVLAILRPGNNIIMSPQFEGARLKQISAMTDATTGKLEAEAKQRSAQGDLFDAQADATSDGKPIA